jgi:hypothetical protein
MSPLGDVLYPNGDQTIQEINDLKISIVRGVLSTTLGNTRAKCTQSFLTVTEICKFIFKTTSTYRPKSRR